MLVSYVECGSRPAAKVVILLPDSSFAVNRTWQKQKAVYFHEKCTINFLMIGMKLQQTVGAQDSNSGGLWCETALNSTNWDLSISCHQCSNRPNCTSTAGETRPMLLSQPIISAFDIDSLPPICASSRFSPSAVHIYKPLSTIHN